MDCGPTCLRMVASFYGRNYPLNKLREFCNINRMGVSLLGISEAAEKIGLRSIGAKLPLSGLEEAQLPCIVHWRKHHFVVLYKIRKGTYYVADPSLGLVRYSREEFLENWLKDKAPSGGTVLLLSPGDEFQTLGRDDGKGINFSFLFAYRKTYSKLIFQLFCGMAASSVLQMIGPFLTQGVVDVGIKTHDLNFITLVLIAQLMIFAGNNAISFIRSWVMMHMTTRLNVTILTDFLAKVMRLPLSFFDTRRSGDIMQRMSDHRRIETFLTGTTLNTLFSLVNLLVYAVVVAYYYVSILVIFAVSTTIYTLWIFLFMKKRRQLDQNRFDNSSDNQSSMFELIAGIQEIKLHNCEDQKRRQWENIQAKLFKFSLKSLSLNQRQQAGAMFFNQGKTILITFLSAKAVIDGDLTLGGMMALQFMAGQLNSPIEQLLTLVQGYQDAKISLERLNEVHTLDDEESEDKDWLYTLPTDKSITLKEVTFRYPGAGNEPVLSGLDMYLPEGKTTAIVGLSGSGKTTILKILLRFYNIESGELWVGDTRLDAISFKEWRKNCGAVMQDGFVFADTIAANIAVGDEEPNPEKLDRAIRMANMTDFIDELPLGLNTKIGTGGNGLSQGQKQRLFIARAIYKNPLYLFFDEATNSLDANNESVIMKNLDEFFEGRTVVVVAHRLSTVRHADNIIVLHKGKIAEQGTHEELIELRGEYFGLVKNQMEMVS